MKEEKCFICKSSYFKEYSEDYLKCLSCGLVFLKKPPKLEELNKVYNAQYYENPYPFGEQALFDSAWRLNRLIQEYKDKGSILDIGCGRGHFLYPFKQSGWRTCGIELFPEEAEYARKVFGLDVFTGKVEEAGVYLDDKSFDAIIMNATLEHFIDPDLVLDIAYNKLNPGGILYIWVPNIKSVFHTLNRKKGLKEGVPFHINCFNTRNLRMLVERHNFRIEHLRTEFLYAFLGEIAKMFNKPSRKELTPATDSTPAITKESLKDKLRKFANKFDEKIGFGASIVAIGRKG
jgi:SAM-dependent methyltransferase